MSVLVLLGFGALLVGHVTAVPHKVDKLPGYSGPVLPDMYTGYVTVSESHGRALFYWLIEAEENPADKPLVVWFQGGPGGSSLFGMLYENGPFEIINYGKELTRRHLSWIKYANVLWFEQPAGVGFSYSNTTSDYNHLNDSFAADDSFAFLHSFITQEMPQYRGRETWLTGESYAGVYLPTVGVKVAADPDIGHQFRGIMNGNPCFACAPDANFGSTFQQFNVLYWHGLVSQQLFDAFNANACNAPQGTTPASPKCKAILTAAMLSLGSDFDGDDLYADECTSNGTLALADSVPPCDPYADRMITYMNRKDVQAALNVRPTKWNGGPSVLVWNYTRNTGSMIPYYERIFATKKAAAEKFDLLIYSGDVDVATVPFAFTMPCLTEFNGTRTAPWKAWHVNGHSAGHWEQFNTHTYATIRGGGHETPAYSPLQALEMFGRFLTHQNVADTAEHQPIRRRKRSSAFVKQSELLARVTSSRG